jgi:hypothetical protein
MRKSLIVQIRGAREKLQLYLYSLGIFAELIKEKSLICLLTTLKHNLSPKINFNMQISLVYVVNIHIISGGRIIVVLLIDLVTETQPQIKCYFA